MSETEPRTADGADEIRADIERTRAQLADTVDALSAKVNVKARAGEKVSEAKGKVQAVSAQVRPYRTQIAAGAAAAALVLVVLGWRRRS